MRQFNNEALEALKKVHRAAAILGWLWLLNNALGLASIVALVWLIWWKLELGIIVGIIALLVGIWVINSVALPMVFTIINAPLAQYAKSGAVRLAVLNVIDDETAKKLTQTKVEYWPRVIAMSMSADEFQDRMSHRE